MKVYLDCIPCFLQQTIQAGRLVTDDESLIRKLVDEAALMIPELAPGATPPELGERIHRRIREVTGIRDPYKGVKEENIREALHLYPEMKKLVEESDNPLLTAAKIAIAGNVIDFGVGKEFEISEDIRSLVAQDLAWNDFEPFAEALGKARSICYLGDNAGESVFDRILIETLGKPVTYVVRDIPVLNDVTREDAVASGLEEVAEIISSGTTAPAVILSLCTDAFIERFRGADMVISKGQGNYEGLSGVDRTVFFLLKAKCHVIAEDIGVKEGDTVLKGIHIDR